MHHLPALGGAVPRPPPLSKKSQGCQAHFRGSSALDLASREEWLCWPPFCHVATARKVALPLVGGVLLREKLDPKFYVKLNIRVSFTSAPSWDKQTKDNGTGS